MTQNYPIGTEVVITEGSGEYHSFNIGEICTIRDVKSSIGIYELYPLQSKQSGIIQGVRVEHFKKWEESPAIFNPTFNEPFPFLTADWEDKADSKPKKTTKSKVVKKEPKKLMIDSVVLSHEKKEEIKAALAQLDHGKLIFEDWGFGDVFEKGTAVTMLFYGTPGTGKTLMAQAIAEDNNAELKIYGMAEIGSSEPGGSERTIQKIFKEARDFFFQEKKQRVILFDECDSLLYDRSKVGVILGAQINALLSEIERHEGIVIFTTNRVGTLDPALERRITAKIEFPFPDEEQRLAIWKRMIPEKAPIAKDVKFKDLAKIEIAGGNIKNAVLNAVRLAAYQQTGQIEMKHFLKAVEREMLAIAAFENNRDHRRHIEDLGITEGRSLTVKDQMKVKMDIKSKLSNRIRKDK